MTSTIKASLQQVFVPTESAWFTKSAKNTWIKAGHYSHTATKTIARACAILQGLAEILLKVPCAIVGHTVNLGYKALSAIASAVARAFCCYCCKPKLKEIDSDLDLNEAFTTKINLKEEEKLERGEEKTCALGSSKKTSVSLQDDTLSYNSSDEEVPPKSHQSSNTELYTALRSYKRTSPQPESEGSSNADAETSVSSSDETRSSTSSPDQDEVTFKPRKNGYVPLDLLRTELLINSNASGTTLEPVNQNQAGANLQSNNPFLAKAGIFSLLPTSQQ